MDQIERLGTLAMRVVSLSHFTKLYLSWVLLRAYSLLCVWCPTMDISYYRWCKECVLTMSPRINPIEGEVEEELCKINMHVRKTKNQAMLKNIH